MKTKIIILHGKSYQVVEETYPGMFKELTEEEEKEFRAGAYVYKIDESKLSIYHPALQDEYFKKCRFANYSEEDLNKIFEKNSDCVMDGKIRMSKERRLKVFEEMKKGTPATDINFTNDGDNDDWIRSARDTFEKS